MALGTQPLTAGASQPIDPLFEKRTYSKVIWRLMPFLFMCYIFAYIDRTNVSFAALSSMERDLGVGDAIIGNGGGIFFLGYMLFQVPCNIALKKIGARRWLGPIMMVWAIVSACTMFVHAAWDFYGIRFLLGIVESGFFPGVILYLTFWFNGRYRAQMVAVFMTAIPLAPFIFSPISTWLIAHFDHVWGLHGWQWLFLLEAIPSLFAGLASLIYLEDGPETAKWLNNDERALICRRLEEDEAHKEATIGGNDSFAQALAKPSVWLFSIIYFGSVSANYLLQFWLPKILKNSFSENDLHAILRFWPPKVILNMFGVDLGDIGFLSMIPWGVTVIAMVVIGRHSDHTGERSYHIALPVAASGLALVASAIPGIPGWLVLVALSIACAGAVTASSSFWSLPSLYLSGTAAAGGIAVINSIGNIGGYFGPSIFGFFSSKFNSTAVAMLVICGFCLLSSVLNIAFFRNHPRKQ